MCFSWFVDHDTPPSRPKAAYIRGWTVPGCCPGLWVCASSSTALVPFSVVSSNHKFPQPDNRLGGGGVELHILSFVVRWHRVYVPVGLGSS